MAHVLILGQTLSGKSTLAKRLAAQYRQSGIGILVHDPVSDPQWQADYKTSDIKEFIKVYWSSRKCAAFFDEAGDSCGNWEEDTKRTARRGRHWGHRNHYISQRGTDIARTIRDQCSTLFLFNSGLEDCKIHAAEWNDPRLREEAPFLATGEYLYITRMNKAQKGHLF